MDENGAARPPTWHQSSTVSRPNRLIRALPAATVITLLIPDAIVLERIDS